MMKSSELVAKVVDIAKHYKTLYVMGCFGAPLTDTNKFRYIKNHPYNMAAARTSMIMAATPDTFGFDCVNLFYGAGQGIKPSPTAAQNTPPTAYLTRALTP